jgi:Zn finger protein HypA/HybF involved in hydrogenase expression
MEDSTYEKFYKMYHYHCNVCGKYVMSSMELYYCPCCCSDNIYVSITKES